MANDYYIPEDGDFELAKQQEQEYQEWLYEMAVIDEINKELNCEKYIPGISESAESFCTSAQDQREPFLQKQIR